MEPNKDIFDHLNLGEVETPDTSYFEQLAKNVVESQQLKIIPLYKKPIIWIGTAAAIFAIMFVLNIGENSEQNVLLALNDIPTEEVFAYIDEHIEDFDTDLISEVLEEENINPVDFIEENLSAQPEIENTDLDFENINTEEILEYLQEEAIDLNDEDEILF